MASCFHYFLGVWNRWWNTRTCFLYNFKNTFNQASVFPNTGVILREGWQTPIESAWYMVLEKLYRATLRFAIFQFTGTGESVMLGLLAFIKNNFTDPCASLT